MGRPTTRPRPPNRQRSTFNPDRPDRKLEVLISLNSEVNIVRGIHWTHSWTYYKRLHGLTLNSNPPKNHASLEAH